MTREEAARILDGAEVMILNRDTKQFNKAIIMAIDALRELDAQERAKTPFLQRGEKEGMCEVMDCFNHDCPFRANKTSSCNRCDCTACHNRRTMPYSISSNRTLTNEELVELERIKACK